MERLMGAGEGEKRRGEENGGDINYRKKDREVQRIGSGNLEKDKEKERNGKKQRTHEEKVTKIRYL